MKPKKGEEKKEREKKNIKKRINYGIKHYPKKRGEKSPQWIICSLDKLIDNMKSIKQDTQDERIRSSHKVKNKIGKAKRTKQYYYRNNKFENSTNIELEAKWAQRIKWRDYKFLKES